MITKADLQQAIDCVFSIDSEDVRNALQVMCDDSTTNDCDQSKCCSDCEEKRLKVMLAELEGKDD